MLWKRFGIPFILFPFFMHLQNGDAQTSDNVPTQQVAKSETKAKVEVLTLEGYLDQVRKENQAYVSSVMMAEGAEKRSQEGLLLTRPALIGSAIHLDDQRQSMQVMQGDEMEARQYSLGFRQQTNFGLDARFIYNQTYNRFAKANPTMFPESEFYTVGPVLELSQALGRNGLGREIRASQQLLSAQAKATAYTERFRQSQILAQAESLYWRLVVAREAVTATRETVDRAERLLSWSDKRQRLNLTNRSDYLQAQANFLARSLELESAVDEEQAASRAFNTFRGVADEKVPETLASFEEKVVNGMKIPERGPGRPNVLAAQQQMLATQANQIVGQERNKPVFNIVATYGLNGRNTDLNEARFEASTDRRPNSSIGLQFDMPLDLWTSSEVRQGYRQEAEAAALAYERTRFEEDRLWIDLTNQFNESLARYRLARKIEAAQRSKLDNERSRHNRGLTTTFQVIQFEQDFANAQLARLRSQAEVINIFAQLKTFGGGS